METSNSFDSSIEDMMRADSIRAALVTGASKIFYFVEEPWTMLEEPWRCRWVDKRFGQTCEIKTLGVPYFGKKYSMFVTSDSNNNVKNYVFLLDQYYFLEGE